MRASPVLTVYAVWEVPLDEGDTGHEWYIVEIINLDGKS